MVPACSLDRLRLGMSGGGSSAAFSGDTPVRDTPRSRWGEVLHRPPSTQLPSAPVAPRPDLDRVLVALKTSITQKIDHSYDQMRTSLAETFAMYLLHFDVASHAHFATVEEKHHDFGHRQGTVEPQQMEDWEHVERLEQAIAVAEENDKQDFHASIAGARCKAACAAITDTSVIPTLTGSIANTYDDGAASCVSSSAVLNNLINELSTLVQEQRTVTERLALLSSKAGVVLLAPCPADGQDNQSNGIISNNSDGSSEQPSDEHETTMQRLPSKNYLSEATSAISRQQSWGAALADAMHRSSVRDSVAKHPKDFLAFHDSELIGCSRCRQFSKLCRRIVHSPFFEPFVGVLIVLNAATLGISIEYELQGRDFPAMATLELIFLIVFFAELALHVCAHGLSIVTHGWGLFDLVVILIGVISQGLLRPIIGNHKSVEAVEQVLILRMMRLLRLVRTVRMMTQFRALWKLTQGFLQCAPTMLSAFSIMLMILYVFACIGADIIGKAQWDDPALAEHVRNHFSSVPRTLLSLVQFITGDSISSLYFPLVVNRPELSIFFVALIMMVTLALMNLVTATLVDDAISMSRMDDEMEAMYTRRRMKQLRPGLTKLFDQIDADGDQLLRMEEVVEAVKTGLHLPKELKGVMTERHILDLFEGLDHDADGLVSIDEFVEGVCSAAISDVPLETVRIVQMLRNAMNQLLRMETALHGIVRGPHEINSRVMKADEHLCGKLR